MTNMKALTELLVSEIISQAEFDRFEKRVAKAVAAAEKAQLVADKKRGIFRAAFEAIDTDGSGMIETSELGEIFDKLGAHPDRSPVSGRDWRPDRRRGCDLGLPRDRRDFGAYCKNAP